MPTIAEEQRRKKNKIWQHVLVVLAASVSESSKNTIITMNCPREMYSYLFYNGIAEVNYNKKKREMHG